MTCGNGIVDPGEQCDDRGPSSTCDEDCSESICGDLNVNTLAGEECDGSESLDETCESLGFDGGQLECSNTCAYDTDNCLYVPTASRLMLNFSPVRQFDFEWSAVPTADSYQLLESPAAGEPLMPLGPAFPENSRSLSMPLHMRHDASYALRVCNVAGCVDSSPVEVTESLVQAVGYIKASNPDIDWFGTSVALSGDGLTLAVGAPREDSAATGIDGAQADDSAGGAGAAYVFVGDGRGTWMQQAYVKASNTDPDDQFGRWVTLSNDGNTMAVGAPYEGSNAAGVNGNQADDSLNEPGAVYVFERDGADQWAQQAYVKASNPGGDEPFGDRFGETVALSGDGNTLAVGARFEDSDASGIDGDQGDGASSTGAVYVFARSGMSQWAQQAYVKASNTDTGDNFGSSVALSDDGNTLAVGSPNERSGSAGINSDQEDDSTSSAGAGYVFVRSGGTNWSQTAYVKASNPGEGDDFGTSVVLSGDGLTLAVGAPGEASNATGVGGMEADDSAEDSGAVYVFTLDEMSQWQQQAYIKASNTGTGDRFGFSVDLDLDGDVLAVGAYLESSVATGLEGNQVNNFAITSGAAYVYVRDDVGGWTPRTYVKASNTSTGDEFGTCVGLDGEGATLTVGAPEERGSTPGVGGDQGDNSLPFAGAVYLY